MTDTSASHNPAPEPTPSEPPVPTRARTSRFGLWGYLGGALLLGALGAGAVGAWHWSGQDGSLQRVLKLAQPWTPTALHIDGVSGSVRHGGAIAQVRWQAEGLTVEVHSLRWTLSGTDTASALWSLWSLWRDQRLPLSTLHAEQVQVRDERPPQASQPPPPLLWPWMQQADVDWSVGELQVSGSTPVRLSAQGQYRYQREGAANTSGHSAQAEHHLHLDRLDWAEGRYHGQVRLSEGESRNLQATLGGAVSVTLPNGRPEPLTVQATLQGKLPATADHTVPDWALQLNARTAAGDAGPGLSLNAALQPWHPSTPLVRAQAQWQTLDLAWLWPQAPRTQLSGSAQISPDDTALAVDLRLLNQRPGPADQGLLPVQDARVKARWQAPTLTIAQADIGAGGGHLQLQGRWSQDGSPWSGQLQMRAVSLQALWAGLPAEPVSADASASATPQGVRLSASASLPREGQAQVLRGEGLWHTQGPAAGRVDVDSAWLRWRGLALDAQGQWHGARQQLQGELDLTLDGNRVQAKGNASPQGGQGRWQLQLPQLHTLQSSWQRWSALPVLSRQLPPLTLPSLQGALQGEGQWSGAWPQLAWQARWTAQDLAVGGVPFTSPSLSLDLQGQGASARWHWQGQHRHSAQPWRTEARGDWRLDGAHQMSLQSLQVAAQAGERWALQLAQAWSLSAEPSAKGWSVQADNARWTLRHGETTQPAELHWSELRWGPQGLISQGGWRGLPLAWADTAHRSWQQLSGAGASSGASPGPLAQAGLGGDLSLQGQWRLRLGADPQASEAQLSIERERGDLRVDLPGLNADQRQAGVDTLALRWTLQQGHSQLKAHWASRRMGRASAEASTPLRLTWPLAGDTWPADSPLSGRLQADLPDLTLWQSLAPPGWRVQGSMDARFEVAGTLAQPRWDGRLQADQLALRSAVQGVEFSQGQLQARLQDQRMVLERLSLRGAGAQGGELSGEGELQWLSHSGSTSLRDVRMDLRLQARGLRVSNRADRRLAVSGDVQARLERGQMRLRGRVQADQAWFVLPEDSTPRLGDDVRVDVKVDTPKTGSRPVAPTGPSLMDTPDVQLTLDLGPDFQLRGMGVNTRLAGSLQLASSAATQGLPRLSGEVRTEGGRYQAYGQQLEIEQGVLRFAGAYDNPALDILALRPNISQHVGVRVSGTARAPRIRLYADPEMPDADKLAWLVLGRSPGGGGAESAVLQQAALALLGGSGKGLGTEMANALGLDTIGIAPSSTENATGAAITLGKRLSKDFYLAYESSVNGTFGSLFIFYDLSRRLTLRAQAGDLNALDLIYTVRKD